MRKVKPGDTVVSKKYEDNGRGIATYVSYDEDKVFIVYGEFGNMQNRKYEITTISDIIVIG